MEGVGEIHGSSVSVPTDSTEEGGEYHADETECDGSETGVHVSELCGRREERGVPLVGRMPGGGEQMQDSLHVEKIGRENVWGVPLVCGVSVQVPSGEVLVKR